MEKFLLDCAAPSAAWEAELDKLGHFIIAVPNRAGNEFRDNSNNIWRRSLLGPFPCLEHLLALSHSRFHWDTMLNRHLLKILWQFREITLTVPETQQSAGPIIAGNLYTLPKILMFSYAKQIFFLECGGKMNYFWRWTRNIVKRSHSPRKLQQNRVLVTRAWLSTCNWNCHEPDIIMMIPRPGPRRTLQLLSVNLESPAH